MGRQRWSLGGPYVEPLAPDRRRLLDIMQRYGQFQPVADATERALRDMTDTPFRPRFERCPHRAVGMPHCSPRRSLDERTGLRGQCKSPRRRAGRKLSRLRSLVVPEHQYRLRPGGEATLCAGAERGSSMRCGAACSIARVSGPA